MANIYQNITELVGRTPIVKLNNIVPEGAAEVYVKLEAFNPGSSVKDRIALSMIEAAERDGLIKPGDTIVEATSGNTGIGLSWVGAAKGYKVVIVMPETMSVERRKIIQAYGAELVLTPGSEGMKGAIAKAEEIAQERNGYNLITQPIQRFTNEQQEQKLSLLSVKLDWMLLSVVSELVGLSLVSLMLLKKRIQMSKSMRLKQTNLLSFLVRNQVLTKSKDFQLASFQRPWIQHPMMVLSA